MKQEHDSGALVPFNFDHILEEVPELRKFGYRISTYSFDPVIDSSDANPDFWVELAVLINKNYLLYDGFVILHGTDTMAYSASALSFMLENLEKPVVFTGSQLPIGMLRTDGKENLISSIEIAASVNSAGRPMVPEVCVFFDNELYRGNRTSKYNAENFKAFRSYNYPVLARAGIHIKFNTNLINYPKMWGRKFSVHTVLDTNVTVVRIFPGISVDFLNAVFSVAGLRAVILETYGSGNAPTEENFLKCIKEAVDEGLIVLNISQCQEGSVEMDTYATGIALKRAGVISGYDLTLESALAKLFYLLGVSSDAVFIKKMLKKNLRGEVSFK